MQTIYSAAHLPSEHQDLLLLTAAALSGSEMQLIF